MAIDSIARAMAASGGGGGEGSIEDIISGDGISVTGDSTKTITNVGVRSVSTSTKNGAISVNTGGTTKDIVIPGLIGRRSSNGGEIFNAASMAVSNAHAEGNATEATAKNSHAEGNTTISSGMNSHTEGDHTEASGLNSHAGGLYTLASGDNQTVIGKYNAADRNKAFIIGGGTSDSGKNIATVDWDGNVVLDGTVTAKDADGNEVVLNGIDAYTKTEVNNLLAEKEDNILSFDTWADYEKVKNTIPADTYFVVKEDEQDNPIPSHNSLMNRDANECHPINAITGLQAELDKKTDADDTAVLKARVDQLVGEVPPGSADEIADARVMIDGKTSQNLGDAIRTQVTSLKETIGTLNDDITNVSADVYEQITASYYNAGSVPSGSDVYGFAFKQNVQTIRCKPQFSVDSGTYTVKRYAAKIVDNTFSDEHEVSSATYNFGDTFVINNVKANEIVAIIPSNGLLKFTRAENTQLSTNFFYLSRHTIYTNLAVAGDFEITKSGEPKTDVIMSGFETIYVDGGFEKTVGQFATNTSGKMTTSTNNKYTTYRRNVKSGDTIRVTALVYGRATALAYICDADDNIIKTVVQGEAAVPNLLENYDVIIESKDAKYIIFTDYSSGTDYIPHTASFEIKAFRTGYDAIQDEIADAYRRWKGKKILCIGDSRTWYDGKTYDASRNVKAEWVGKTCVGYQQSIARLTGAEVISSGHSGYASTDLVPVIQSIDFAQYDAVFLEGGVNDFMKNIPVGNIATIGGSFDTTTAYGAWQTIVETIIASNPAIEIYMDVAPIAWKDNGVVYTYALAEVKEKVAELYNIPCLNLYKNGGINELNRDYWYVDDPDITGRHLHFNDYGNKLIGEKIAEFIVSN